jgi:A/G-specific adenine glycosylase
VTESSTVEILNHWQGLGYNRRGLNLKRSCEVIVDKFNNHVPRQKELLMSLPGIGDYTSSAIKVFSWNDSEILLETNIRTVLIYHFYEYQNPDLRVKDKELKILLSNLHKEFKITDYRKWFWGLMDYGSELKKAVGNLNKQSDTYTKQSQFKGSWRELRSIILKNILKKESVEHDQIYQIDFGRSVSKADITKLIDELKSEGFINSHDNRYTIS